MQLPALHSSIVTPLTLFRNSEAFSVLYRDLVSDCVEEVAHQQRLGLSGAGIVEPGKLALQRHGQVLRVVCTVQRGGSWHYGDMGKCCV